MRTSLIVAMSDNRVIGRNGTLPWRLSADLRRFKRLTMGHHIIMGRKTYESIGRPLPGRTSVVISRDPDYQPRGVFVAHSIGQARELSVGDSEVFFIGGGEIYRQVLPEIDRIYLTQVHAHVDGDTFFPQWDSAAWRLIESSEAAADEKNQYAHSFLVYDRVQSNTD
jgi:dihydrofolate reductase